MSENEIPLRINTNPLIFEELATSLASLISYVEGGRDLSVPIDDFKHLFTNALRQPASYLEVTELTGQSMSIPDRRSSRGAWLLMNIEKLAIYGVHLQLWHKNGDKYSVPIIDQISRILKIESKIKDSDFNTLGHKYKLLDINLSLLDIVGVRGKSVWLVQCIHKKELVDSAIKKMRMPRLFRSNVFKNVIFKGMPLTTLFNAYNLFSKSFPSVPIIPMVLVLHPTLPDFELYSIDTNNKHSDHILLRESMIKNNSINYEDELKIDNEALWILPHRLDNPLFKGLPPCRGGRTLSILASTCSRQLNENNLLIFKENEIRQLLLTDFNFDLPRDKVRHDLLDRLVGQGFMKKWGSEYSITVKGIARYQYCLAKYTTIGTDDPEYVLKECSIQRNRIVQKYGSI